MYHIRRDEALAKHNRFQLHHELIIVLISLSLFYEQDNTCVFCMYLLVLKYRRTINFRRNGQTAQT